MNTESGRIFAVVECMILWDYLATTGMKDKQEAIINLYRKKQLHKNHYFSSCPFCDFFEDCNSCLWPKYYKGQVRFQCCAHSSPFSKWKINRNKETAKGVLDMLKSISF